MSGLAIAASPPGSAARLGACLMCGACCRAIALPYTKTQLRRQVAAGALAGSDLESARFILRHWRRIGRAAAVVAVPGLQPEPGCRYYACTKLAGNLCSDHASRPDICRGFPYYGEPEATNVDDRLAWAGCGFHSSRSQQATSVADHDDEPHRSCNNR